MTVDQKVVMDFVDETREFEVKEAIEVPPIPLWKVGFVLLALFAGGAGAYHLTKGGEGR